jgi:L-seryl-tRNA(Ser) seleniumtransferase
VLKCKIMSSAADPTPDRRPGLLRRIPSVDELLALPSIVELAARIDRPLLVEAARAVLQRLRDDIVNQRATAVLSAAGIGDAIAAEAARQIKPSLRAVINATGVILHTNLGRAPLARQAIERIRSTAGLNAAPAS